MADALHCCQNAATIDTPATILYALLGLYTQQLDKADTATPQFATLFITAGTWLS